MKQLLIILAVIFSITATAQTSKDTTKKIKVPVDTAYILEGSVQGFQLLFKAVSEPGKVTRDEINILLQWMTKIQMIEVPKKQKQ